MPERRTVPRRKMAFYFQVLDAATEEIVGHLTDISVKGLLLDRQQPLNDGTVLKLRIETPPGQFEAKFIDFTARSVWCRPDAMVPNVFNIGMEITHIDPLNTQMLERIFEVYTAS